MAEACLQVSNVLGLVANANGQLKDRKWNQAIAIYEKAQAVYPTLPKDLSFRLKRLIAEMLMVEGRDMVRFGNNEGLAILRDARRYDPELMSDPEAAFKRFSLWLEDDKNQNLADVKKGQGEKEAKRGDLKAAIEYFKEAQQLSPNLFRGGDFETEAKRLVGRANFDLGIRAAHDGKKEEAIRYFTDAKSNDPSLFKDRTPEIEATRNLAIGRVK
jgi:tetratricopeptide (TPR) repeat protein